MDFQGLKVDSETFRALEALNELHEELKLRLGQRQEYLDGAIRLDVESRSEDAVRIFKHLHQMSFGHVGVFLAGTGVRLASVMILTFG